MKYTVNELAIKDIRAYMEHFSLVRDWLTVAEKHSTPGVARNIIDAAMREVADIEGYVSNFVDGIQEVSR
jgi:hypothetical protein